MDCGRPMQEVEDPPATNACIVPLPIAFRAPPSFWLLASLIWLLLVAALIHAGFKPDYWRLRHTESGTLPYPIVSVITFALIVPAPAVPGPSALATVFASFCRCLRILCTISFILEKSSVRSMSFFHTFYFLTLLSALSPFSKFYSA